MKVGEMFPNKNITMQLCMMKTKHNSNLDMCGKVKCWILGKRMTHIFWPHRNRPKALTDVASISQRWCLLLASYRAPLQKIDPIRMTHNLPMYRTKFTDGMTHRKASNWWLLPVSNSSRLLSVSQAFLTRENTCHVSSTLTTAQTSLLGNPIGTCYAVAHRPQK